MSCRVFHRLTMAPSLGWGQQKRGWGSFVAEQWARLCAFWWDCGLWDWAVAVGGVRRGLWVWTARCPAGFRSRSFENNWNIYKLLAHQKISKEKVRWCRWQSPWVRVCPWGLPAAARPGSRELLAGPAGPGPSLLRGLSSELEGSGSAFAGPAAAKQPVSGPGDYVGHSLIRQL